jgi:amidohydrolase
VIKPDAIRAEATRFHEDAVRIRRHLHQNPELSFQESETAKFVSSELASIGIPHTKDVGGHGVVGRVEGTDAGPVIALRADMDALPIVEENTVDYCSANRGVMHACGHDAHTASLLTTARILHELRDRFAGTIKLLFQPAEERSPGGASAMIRDGALDSPRVERVFGQHVNTELPVGTVGFRPGLFMASADEIYLTVHGRGGHAAKPHQGVDPVAIASAMIVSLQQIVSRNADPTTASVLTFGRFVADGSMNVIPDRVEIADTLRAVDDEWRDEALERVERVAKGVVESMGGTVDVKIIRGYPSLENDPGETAIARTAAEEYLGPENVVDLPLVMWAEDFAYYCRERPSCFYNLGVRNESEGIVHPVHTPRFNIDESALEIGPGLMAWIAVRRLESTFS